MALPKDLPHPIERTAEFMDDINAAWERIHAQEEGKGRKAELVEKVAAQPSLLLEMDEAEMAKKKGGNQGGDV